MMTTADNLVYHIGDFKVDVTQRQVVTPEQIINVRPKTFSLLLLFLQNPSQVLQKEFLLNQLWDDVCVDEQVLVQSIGELRKIFATLNVIQTHPRKGYAWVVAVEKQQQTNELIPAVIPPLAYSKRFSFFAALVFLVLMVLFALGYWAFKHYATPAAAAKNIVTVLPINNRTEGSNLLWVRLGMMDQLIQSLQSSPDVQVFDVPYVLHLLEVSGVDANQRVKLVNRIFELSGSSLVVDLELSGSVNDYRLLYRLYSRAGEFSGVLVERELDRLIENMAGIIATKTDAQLELSHLDKAFNSSVLAEAVQHWDAGQTDTAIALLKSAIALEPGNFLAHQFLVEYELQQAKWLQAAITARRIIASAEANPFEKIYVFYYLLAKAELAQGNFEQARQALTSAQQLAEQGFDSLYQAYIATSWADLSLAMGDEQRAEDFYRRALGLHQSIACPIGEGITRVNLIGLFVSKKRNDLAIEQWNQLNTLVTAHKLSIELPALAGK